MPLNWFYLDRICQPGIQLNYYFSDVPQQPRTLAEAWSKTLEKWTLLSQGYWVYSDTLTEGLCNRYRFIETHERGRLYESCHGCPVYEVSNVPGCRHTPYVEYQALLHTQPAQWAKLIRAARRHYDFLKWIHKLTVNGGLQ